MTTIVLIGVLIITIIKQIYQLKNNSNKLTKNQRNIVTFTGFITNFLDFWGIGSFAPQTFVLTRTKIINSKNLDKLPGTLNIGNLAPIIIEAIFFIYIFNVDIILLTTLALAASIGSYYGARLVTSENMRKIQIIVSYALIIAGLLLLTKQLKIGPFNNLNAQTNLSTTNLIIALISYLILGAMQSIGLGLYAPGFAILSLLGLNPTIILPINMIASIALMVSANQVFYKNQQYIGQISKIITISGIMATLLAGIILISLGQGIIINQLFSIITYMIALIVIIDGINKLIKLKEK